MSQALELAALIQLLNGPTAWFTRAARLARVDHATFFSAASKIWGSLAGIVSIALIVKAMSPEVQGFYYTFASLLALQVLLELGFSYVIVQVTAHEFAISREHPDPNQREFARSRLISLLRLSLQWYAVIALVFWLGCSLAGEIFFRVTYAGNASHWQGAWLSSVTMFSACIVLIPIYAILDGSNEIAAVAKTRIIQDLFGYSIFWLSLLAGQGLYSVAGLYLGKLIGSGVGLTLTGLKDRIKALLGEAALTKASISWRKEIFPFQWKIALSWLSGYLIFQLYSPVLFATQGATIAGQAGMTIAIYSGVNSVMYTWISAKIPRFCELVALKKWGPLNDLFRKTVLASSVIIAVGLSGLTSAIIVLRPHFPSLSERFLGNGAIICFAMTALVNHFILSIAAYARAYKEEPFLIPSIVGAMLTAACVIFLARYSAFAVALGCCVMTMCCSLPWTVKIYLSYRKAQVD